VGDIDCPATACGTAGWRTILVGGLNGGGRGYYALDITHPGSPRALWEFTDTDLGYTYGNPVITKLKNGTWVVLVASGYNNVSGGDGQGRLYVLDAASGALIRSIATGAGSTATPSGLARINAWVDNAMADNTALRVYGGDLLGNLWRFDINGDVGASGYDAQLLATFRDAYGTAQPITARPELGEASGKALVFVGTGRLLGMSDLADTSRQSFYAVLDPLDATHWGDPRSSGRFVQQTLTIAGCPSGAPATLCSAGDTVRLGSNHAVNFATNGGWYLDLPDTGERADTDPVLVFGTLAFNTNVPDFAACTHPGRSYRYFLDYRTGGFVAVPGNGTSGSTEVTGVVGRKLGDALTAGPSVAALPSRTVIQLSGLSNATTVVSDLPIDTAAGGTRRVSWRHLISE
jgi:type IV pilus assembly protein PilY1